MALIKTKKHWALSFTQVWPSSLPLSDAEAMIFWLRINGVFTMCHQVLHIISSEQREFLHVA